MIKFILGVLVGIVIGTVGLSGVVRIADGYVNQIKTVTKDAVQ